MREIEFRGFDGAEWIYGSAVLYDKETDTWYMIEHGSVDDDWIMVGHVGQYIGMKDENKQKIYEGDIMEFNYNHNGSEEKEVSPVVWYGDGEWQYPAYDFDGIRIKKHYFEGNIIAEVIGSSMYSHKVVGNIHDNPELLNQNK